MSNTHSTKRFRRTLAVLAVLAGGLIGGSAAQAVPLAAPPAVALAADGKVETVQWHHHHHGWGHRRHHWGHHHGWRRPHWGHHHHGWGHRRHHWGHHHGWGHRRHHWGHHHHGWRRHHHFY